MERKADDINLAAEKMKLSDHPVALQIVFVGLLLRLIPATLQLTVFSYLDKHVILQVKLRALAPLVFELEVPTRDSLFSPGLGSIFLTFFFPHMQRLGLYTQAMVRQKDCFSFTCLPTLQYCLSSDARVLGWKCQCANLQRFTLSPCQYLCILGHLCTFPGVSKCYPPPTSYPKFLGTARGGKFPPSSSFLDHPYINCEVCQASVSTIPGFETYFLL